MTVKFKPFYTEYWNVFPGTMFQMIRLSNSLQSAWIDMRGRGIVCVPCECLMYTDGSRL